MNNHPLLAENEGKRIAPRLPWLFLFSLYCSWQLGIMYFSGRTMSLNGTTTLGVSIDNATFLIAAGYICSIIFITVFPRCIVWAERITAAITLASTLALYLSLSPEILTGIYYFQAFICLFMAGFEMSLMINLFSEETTLKFLLLADGFCNITVAVLQNEFFPVSFHTFRFVAVIMLAGLCLTAFKMLPVKRWPTYLKKSDGFTVPKSFISGVFILIMLDCFATVFGIAVAESIPHGVSTLYVSAAICGVIVYLIWKKFRIAPLKSGKVLMAFGVIGFVLAIASQFIPAFGLIACILLGAGVVVCWLNSFFGLLIAKRYPSRYIAPATVAIAFMTVLIHALLLDILRNNLTALYVVYLVIAVTMAILYFMLEPYLLYSFRGRTFQEIIGIVAEDKDEPAPANQDAPKPAQSRPPLLRTAHSQTVRQAAPPVEKTLHERRMEMLMNHALTPLTRREYQVADCIMRGLRRSEISEEMQILPESVTRYTNQIYNKFEIHRRQDLFRLAETLNREWEGE